MRTPGEAQRLRFLSEVVQREVALLLETDARLFDVSMDAARARSLRQDGLLAERVDAFVARFGRLQDTVGDKLLPALLGALGESVGPVIDNLARAERFGWLDSADRWIALRRLRNQMVHEYVTDPEVLADALQAAHEGVAMLATVARQLCSELGRRWPALPDAG